MGNYKRRRRCKLVSGPSILRIFGSSYKYKKEAAVERKRNRDAPRSGEKTGTNIATHRSVHAISTPFGGMNKKR